MDNERHLIDAGTAAEAAAGFSQALRCGDWILVSGTNASDDDGSVAHPGDAAGQARVTFSRIADALERAGGSLKDVVRTRVFLRNADDAAVVAKVHNEVLGSIRPANSFVQAAPIGDERLVEIEADAIVVSDAPDAK